MAQPFLRGFPLYLLTFALSLGSFLMVLDYSIANVSLPYIAGDLAVSNNDGTWVITMFAIGNAIVLPMSGWLANQFGSVRVMVGSTALFTLASWLCAASFSFPMLVLMRFLQGVVSGPMLPMSQSLLLLNHPPESRKQALAFWQTIIVVGPIIGPILGGWICQDSVWPWIFYINLPVGTFCFLIVFFLLKNRETSLDKQHLDWTGFALLCFAIIPLQIFLDRGEQYDWFHSKIIVFLAVVAAVSFIALIWREWNHPKPLIDLKLFKIKTFAAMTFALAVSYMLFFSAVVLTPLWLQTRMGYDSLNAGLVVAPMGIVSACTSMLIERTMVKVGEKPLLFLSFIFFASVFFYTATFTTDVSFEKISLSRFFLGIAIAFYVIPLFTLSVKDIPRDKLSMASGIFFFFRSVASAVGTSLFVYFWDRRSIFYHSRLIESTTPYNDLTNEAFSLFEHLEMPKEAAREQLNILLDQQAYMLGLNDIFYLMGWCYLGLALLLLFLKTKQLNGEGALHKKTAFE